MNTVVRDAIPAAHLVWGEHLPSVPHRKERASSNSKGSFQNALVAGGREQHAACLLSTIANAKAPGLARVAKELINHLLIKLNSDLLVSSSVCFVICYQTR